MELKIVLRCVLICLSISACTMRMEVPDKDKELIIAIVGDGVLSEFNTGGNLAVLEGAVVEDNIIIMKACGASSTPLNRAQGEAMWLGIKSALKNSPSLKWVNQNVKFALYDDRGMTECAEAFAKEIILDPRIVAVIGHSTSSTTKVANEYYSRVGLPLMMPIATSPFVMCINGSEDLKRLRCKYRCTNAFRLPANDMFQAASVIHLVKSTLNISRDIYLLQDTSKDAETYSTPLKMLLNRYFNDSLVGSIDRDRPADVIHNIQAANPKLIIFCGYGSTANVLFSSLRQIYKDTPIENRPKIILTDGSWIGDLDGSGFVVYLTFPSPNSSFLNEIDANEVRTNKQVPNPVSKGNQKIFGQVIVEANKDGTDESFQLFGFDSMLILGDVFARCERDKDLSRNSILKKLANPENYFEGAFFGYAFSAGERTVLTYHVYQWSVDVENNVSQSFGSFLKSDLNSNITIRNTSNNSNSNSKSVYHIDNKNVSQNIANQAAVADPSIKYPKGRFYHFLEVKSDDLRRISGELLKLGGGF